MTCPECGNPVALQDRFCEGCGAPIEAAGHRETDLGPAAAVTDRGHLRSVNEDAFEVHAGPRALAGVVCDGVSTTSSAGLAAEAACRAAMDRLVTGIDATGPIVADVEELAGEAVTAGQDALRGADGSTTIALGFIVDGQVVVANVGDSRAYWIAADGGHQMLSVDDAGRPHEITAWLGPDADPVVPHITRMPAAGPGVLVLCSDGMWNYAEEPATVAGLLTDHVGCSPRTAAQVLVRTALAAGGADNVTVVVLEHTGPPDTGPEEQGVRHGPG